MLNRHSESVLICGIIPRRRTSTLSPGFLGGEDWPEFLELAINIVAETQLIYVQKYVSPDIVEPTNFQVVGGWLRIDSFGK